MTVITRFAKLLTATLVSLCAIPQIAVAINPCRSQVIFSTQNLGTVTGNPYTAFPTGDPQVSPRSTTLTFSGPGPFSIPVGFNYEPECPNEIYQVTFTGTYALPGYIDPKFVVVGVTYAPPGPSASTFVQYTNSTTVGNTSTLSSSFSSSITNTVSVTAGFSYAIINGSVTESTASTVSQKQTETGAVTTSVQVQDGEKTFGTANYFAPVNHDYDTIWVWLNPALVFSVTPSEIVWNGYGFDAADVDDADIVPIPLGYLNGDFGPIPADLQTSLNRAWAANQIYAPGDSAPLTSADLAVIAEQDPFSASTYGVNYLGSNPPVQTADERFTQSQCETAGTTVVSGLFYYLQAAPSTTPSVYTCNITYTSSTTSTQALTSSYQVKYSLSASLNVGFGQYLKAGITDSSSQTLTWTQTAQQSTTTTGSSTAALSIQGPPCGNTPPSLACSPVYDAAGGQPTQFEIYEDNKYGTFMFAPVNYY